MIPNDSEVLSLWDKYKLPEEKRIHVSAVARVSAFLSNQIITVDPTISIHTSLLRASSLLHDIDKAVLKHDYESHPDAAVRILREEKMPEVAGVVGTHALHCILDETMKPSSWEERLLYLADKMVKQDVITVDERFRLWREERLPDSARLLLDQTYPLVKQLESEIFTVIRIKPEDVAKLA